MSRTHPELIFLCGPQSPQRVVIRKDVAVAGRSPACEIPLAEESASRQQIRFEASPDGWIVENMSSNGTVINGKRYKTGKKIILATGDVLSFGVRTQALFVAPGDDAQAAVAAWRQANPPAPAAPPAAPAEEAQPEPQNAPAEPPVDEVAPKTAPVTLRRADGSIGGRSMTLAGESPKTAPIQAEKKKPSSKRRKYVVLGAVYMVFFAAFIAVLKLFAGGDGPLGDSKPPHLDDRQIADFITAPAPPQPLDAVQASQRLAGALALYEDRNDKPGNLYQVVNDFKLHLAYAGRPDFKDVQNARYFRIACDELVDKVQKKYMDAWKFEQDGNWTQAERLFAELRLIVPAPEGPIFQNCNEHLLYVRKHIPKKK